MYDIDDLEFSYRDNLGDEQQEAFDWYEAEGLFDPMENKAFSLKGAAGVGKTFLSQAIIEHCLREGIPVAATATTNQAVNVLEGKLPMSQDSVSTIHSLLGLKMTPDYDTGEMKLVKDEDKPLNLPDKGIVLVDEASMESWRLCREIEKERKQRNISFLHVGDPSQLPPVEQVEEGRTRFPGLSFPGVELETIHRQALDNPIIVAATAIREGKNYISRAQTKNGQGVALYSSKQVMQSAYARFTSEEYDKNPLHARILAATNKVVRHWNRKMTEAIYGDHQKFHEGMWVISMDAWVPNKQILLYTSQLLKIKELKKYSLDLREQNIKWNGEVWEMTCLTQKGREIKVLTLTEDAKESFQAQLDEYKEGALDGQRWKWYKYYTLKNAVADIEPCYASTIHKAQGTSIEYVYVMEQDIRSFPTNKDFNIRQALRYVAVSRGEIAVGVNTYNCDHG